jgi:hypothetical protein
MGITIFIASAFILLIALGMFRVSQLTVRALGFLSFIFFFEFIIMILDHWIHSLTHGEPLKSWLIKIVIISILLPLHHLLEHKVIHYLLSHKMLHARPRLSIRRLASLFKRPKQVATPPAEVLPVGKASVAEANVVSYKLTVEDK